MGAYCCASADERKEDSLRMKQEQIKITSQNAQQERLSSEESCKALGLPIAQQEEDTDA